MTKKKVEELTQEQKAMVPTYRDRGIRIGMKTGNGTMDEAKVRELTDKHREMCGFKKATYFVVGDSPHHMLNVLKSKGINSGNALHGNQDIHWLNYYNFYREQLGLIEQTEKIVHLLELANHVSWMWFSSDATLVCHLPVEICSYERDLPWIEIEGKPGTFRGPELHNESGRSIRFKDGSGSYHLWGQYVPDTYDWLIKTAVEDLDPKKILDIDNTDIRSAAIKKIGIERMFDKLDKKLLSEKTFPIGGTYKLWSLDFSGSERIYLEMKCPSEGITHIEGVDPRCRTVDAARSYSEQLGIFTIEEMTKDGFEFVESLSQS